ncbi:MAG: PadR family transcriptional regulator [Candidatus Aenigmarchaeota archaeon]|nr:PadR family transcriptional regulator [Candidatus Aenigmarchaeota archaeon]
MRGLLGFLVLFLISKKPMNGQEIAEEIEKRKGCKPSPGTIYPALKNLKEEGFIKEKKEGKSIEYTLTPEGINALKIAKKRFCKTFIGVYK